MGIGLSIVFSGLCALVTDDGLGTGQVLLVDGQSMGEVGGLVLPEHAPTLVLGLGSLVNPDASGPDRVVAGWPDAGSGGLVGLWDLTGSEVRIRVQGGDRTGVRVVSSAEGASSWPDPPRNRDDPASWRDIRFIADMTSIVGDGRIDPELLSNPAGRLPRGVGARILLDGGLVEAGVPSREEYRDDVFEFSGSDSRGTLRQALTDTIRWSLQASADAVVIEIAPVAGGTVRRLVLKPSEAPHRLSIGNMPADGQAHAPHGLTEDAVAALHFGAYYELLRQMPDSRPMPRLVSPDERRSTGAWSGPFCPPARFRSH